MLLSKSLKVFKTGWKGALAVAAVIVVLCLGLGADLLGVERVIPDADQVASVWVRGPDSIPGDTGANPNLDVEDPALIQRLLAVHQTVIDHRQELKANLDAYWNDEMDTLGDDVRFRDFEVEYALRDGRFLSRSYDLILSPAELDDPDSVASALDGLLADPVFNRLNYELDDVEENRLTQVAVRGLEGVGLREVVFYSPLSDYAGNESPEEQSSLPAGEPAEGPVQVETRYDNMDLRPASQDDLAALFRAVEADFQAGNLGKRWLLADNDAFNANTCFTVLEFYWNERVEWDGEVFYNQRSVSISLTPQAKGALAALEELGLFEDGAYISNYNDERVYPQ